MYIRSSMLYICILFVSTMLSAKSYQYKSVDIFDAARQGYKKDISQYLKSGVDINALDNDAKTILDYAVENNHKHIVYMLVKKRAKLVREENLQTLNMLVNKHFWHITYVSFGLFLLPLAIGIAGIFVANMLTTAVLVLPYCMLVSFGGFGRSLYWKYQSKYHIDMLFHTTLLKE